ncbi:hypothetical protein [Streptomyces sp. NPDC045714]|uniref:hypothetical protein n=1 Tax=Streptomyces sp. NPDC045714 TaxID=3154913 RepID=UPI00340FE0BC
MSGSQMTPGTCSACGGEAECGPSGGWWHTGTSCGRFDAEFRAARQQGAPPRDRQINEPRRNR